MGSSAESSNSESPSSLNILILTQLELLCPIAASFKQSQRIYGFNGSNVRYELRIISDCGNGTARRCVHHLGFINVCYCIKILIFIML